VPGIPGTSSLSPHLHFGEIGPRQILQGIECQTELELTAQDNSDPAVYVRELGWREFAHHLLYHYPHTSEQPLDPRFHHFPWQQREQCIEHLSAWQQGNTGIPIVDAGMRELWRTGWMHNRVRMIVASLLTKNLGIRWQEGTRWFWDTLVDADLANNTLGWQWTAGCGADAAPFFRIFNPVRQSERFDLQGRYLRRWLPELDGLPDAQLHAPWEANPVQLKTAGVKLGKDYPLPIVNLKLSRQQALENWESIKSIPRE
jgi:deoxyribodipyrimidine photo-lyase